MEFFALQVLHTNPKCDINIANFDWELVFSVSELYEIFSNEFNFEITCFIHIDISFFIENNSFLLRQLHLRLF